MPARLCSLLVRGLTVGFTAGVVAACQTTKLVDPAESGPSVTPAVPRATGDASSAAAPPAPPPPSASAPCLARRPFVSVSAPANEGLLALPAPFQAFAPCAALTAVFPDYDPQSERSVRAGGVVRANGAGLFLHAGRELLVLIDYRGKEAEAEMVSGCDPFHAHLSILARGPDQSGLVVVARGSTPVEHAGVGSAVAVGVGTTTTLPLRENDPALVVRSEIGCGTAPARTAAHVFVLEPAAATLREVLAIFVGARGMDRRNELHSISATLAPRPLRGRTDGWPDLALAWSDTPCPFDDQAGDFTCKQGKPVGTDVYAYDGQRYVRRGARTKVPFL